MNNRNPRLASLASVTGAQSCGQTTSIRASTPARPLAAGADAVAGACGAGVGWVLVRSAQTPAVAVPISTLSGAE
jgi:hypothetical protein